MQGATTIRIDKRILLDYRDHREQMYLGKPVRTLYLFILPSPRLSSHASSSLHLIEWMH
jgi:hypothetical protein